MYRIRLVVSKHGSSSMAPYYFDGGHDSMEAAKAAVLDHLVNSKRMLERQYGWEVDFCESVHRHGMEAVLEVRPRLPIYPAVWFTYTVEAA